MRCQTELPRATDQETPARSNRSWSRSAFVTLIDKVAQTVVNVWFPNACFGTPSDFINKTPHCAMTPPGSSKPADLEPSPPLTSPPTGDGGRGNFRRPGQDSSQFGFSAEEEVNRAILRLQSAPQPRHFSLIQSGRNGQHRGPHRYYPANGRWIALRGVISDSLGASILSAAKPKNCPWDLRRPG